MAPLSVHSILSSSIPACHAADVVVIGAGVFDTALAITLARQSRTVVLLERSFKEADRIVGELMHPGDREALRKLGLDDCLEDFDAIPVTGYACEAQENLRAEGRSFHHGRFIQRLRLAARNERDITMVETDVKALLRDSRTDAVIGARCAKNNTYRAPLTVIADGFNSRFRKQFSLQRPSSKSSFWALELKNAKLPFSHHGHVLLGKGAPILLYQISSTDTRILVDIPSHRHGSKVGVEGIVRYFRQEVHPTLPSGTQDAFETALLQSRPKGMPNSFLPASCRQVAGLLMGGDALTMRHPLTGGGMTVAWNDVVLLSQLLAPSVVPDLGDDEIIKQLRKFHGQRKRSALVLNLLAEALYALFAAGDDIYLGALQRECFEYFKKGGSYTDGPAGLIAGISRNPWTLLYHFFLRRGLVIAIASPRTANGETAVGTGGVQRNHVRGLHSVVAQAAE